MSVWLSEPQLQALIIRCRSHGSDYTLDPEMTTLLGFERAPGIRLFGIQDTDGVYHMFGVLLDVPGVLLIRSMRGEMYSYRLGPMLELITATARRLGIVTSLQVTEDELATEFRLWRTVASDLCGASPPSSSAHH